jgi:hypothetical protein
MRLKTGVFLTLALTVGTAGLNAQGRGKSKHTGSNDTEVGAQSYSAKTSVSVSIGSHDQRVIREWFSNPSNLKGLPPGLAKRETLPPGLQRQLVRNGQLPPGLQKKIQPLPPALEVVLAPLPEGRKRVFISGSVILLDQRKNLILDMVAVF